MNLDRQIQLHQLTTTRNNSGQYVPGYALNSTVYAALNPTLAREDNSGYQLYSQSLVRWVIRYNTEVQHTWQVKHLHDVTDVYEIVGILHNGRRTYTTLLCRLRDYEQ